MPATAETVRAAPAFCETGRPAGVQIRLRKMYEAARDLLQRNHKTADDVDVLIPHQANRRIITAAAERLGINCEKVIINIDRYGNTTAATIPLATRDAIQCGKLKKGDLVVFAAVGAGYTVGANLWRWEM